MGHLLDPVQGPDVIQGVDARGQATVKAEDLVLDESGQGEKVKEVCEVLPHVGIAIFPKTLIVETVDLGDLSRFVVSSEDSDALGVSDFESDEKSDGFDRVVATVDIIP